MALYGTGTILVQVKACCHCQNQWWLVISGVSWHSREGNFIGSTLKMNPWNSSLVLGFTCLVEVFLIVAIHWQVVRRPSMWTWCIMVGLVLAASVTSKYPHSVNSTAAPAPAPSPQTAPTLAPTVTSLDVSAHLAAASWSRRRARPMRASMFRWGRWRGWRLMEQPTRWESLWLLQECVWWERPQGWQRWMGSSTAPSTPVTRAALLRRMLPCHTPCCCSHCPYWMPPLPACLPCSSAVTPMSSPLVAPQLQMFAVWRKSLSHWLSFTHSHHEHRGQGHAGHHVPPPAVPPTPAAATTPLLASGPSMMKSTSPTVPRPTSLYAAPLSSLSDRSRRSLPNPSGLSVAHALTSHVWMVPGPCVAVHASSSAPYPSRPCTWVPAACVVAAINHTSAPPPPCTAVTRTHQALWAACEPVSTPPLPCVKCGSLRSSTSSLLPSPASLQPRRTLIINTGCHRAVSSCHSSSRVAAADGSPHHRGSSPPVWRTSHANLLLTSDTRAALTPQRDRDLLLWITWLKKHYEFSLL